MTIKASLRFTDLLKTIACIAVATCIAYFLKKNGNTTDAMSVIYMLMVVIVSRITNGYVWGILTSFAGVMSANFLFTYPYLAFNFELAGYPVTFTAMLIISCMISALTTQNKKQTEAAIALAKKLQETYEEQRAIEIIAEKEKLKGNLLKAVSHDLRTPLTTIIGASSAIIENDAKMDKKTRDFLVRDIHEESEWLLKMVENLLAVTHLSRDSMKVIKSPEVAEEIVAEAVARIKSKLPEHLLTVKVPDELLIVPMDATLIEQVIINLVDNSIKHAGKGAHIYVSLSKEENWAVFEVKDNGMGMAESDIQHLFNYGEKNDSAPSSDSSRGYGIGLPTCKTIITAHSGEITVESQLGIGTKFLFKLPLEDI